MRINQIDEIYPKLEKNGITTFEQFLSNMEDLQIDVRSYRLIVVVQFEKCVHEPNKG